MLASTTETDPRVNILMLQPAEAEEASECFGSLGGMPRDTSVGASALTRGNPMAHENRAQRCSEPHRYRRRSGVLDDAS